MGQLGIYKRESSNVDVWGPRCRQDMGSRVVGLEDGNGVGSWGRWSALGARLGLFDVRRHLHGSMEVIDTRRGDVMGTGSDEIKRQDAEDPCEQVEDGDNLCSQCDEQANCDEIGRLDHYRVGWNRRTRTYVAWPKSIHKLPRACPRKDEWLASQPHLYGRLTTRPRPLDS